MGLGAIGRASGLVVGSGDVVGNRIARVVPPHVVAFFHFRDEVAETVEEA